jgi:putative glutamine amidotransferase
MIQDLGTFFDEQGKTYHYQHREEPVEGKTRDFAIHDVTVTDSSSLLRKIVGTDVIRDVPSWHHQAVRSVEGTPLKVTAITPTEGIDIIEAVERTDKRFIIGVQYHPEVAVAKHTDHVPGASNYMPYDEALCYFRALKEMAINH